MKTFEHEWVLEDFEGHPSFHTKRMFGGLAVYLFERQMMVLVEPTQSGRWHWHGILICTDFPHHESLIGEFPRLAPHEILGKWLWLPSAEDDFETVILGITKRMLANDRRLGIVPKPKRPRKKGRRKTRSAPGAAKRS